MITFITGNEGKSKEVKSILGDMIMSKNIDLVEIQEIDAYKIIEAKLKEAFKNIKKACLIEDTSLYINCLNGFPGPLIKWMLKGIENEGIYKIISKNKDKTAVAKTIFGYIDNDQNIHFFEGSIDGIITKPKGYNGFGWDMIFVPQGADKTFAQMTIDEKNKYSMRKKALMKFKRFLSKK